MAVFDFYNQITAQRVIDIPDMGNFALEAINEDDRLCYYLLVRTSLGTATILSFGPIDPEVTLIPSGYTCTLTRISFDTQKLSRHISRWLNEYKKNISKARLIEPEELLDNCRDMRYYFANYGDEMH